MLQAKDLELWIGVRKRASDYQSLTGADLDACVRRYSGGLGDFGERRAR